MKITNSQINLSEASEHFFKNNKAHRAQKDISEALEQMTTYSERYKCSSMSSRIIMQLYEDSLTFPNHVCLSQKVCTARRIVVN